jgi:hypothetical protein
MKSTERLHGRKVFVCKRSALKDCGAEIINASGLVLLAKRGRG